MMDGRTMTVILTGILAISFTICYAVRATNDTTQFVKKVDHGLVRYEEPQQALKGGN